MYLKIANNTKTGRTYLSIVHGYHDTVSKLSRTRTIKSIGYLDELQKQYDDPITHFKSLAAKMDKERLTVNS